MLISPSEPSLLRAAGKVSMLPEQFGADVLIVPHASFGGYLGVQRKELKDLIASLADGRLGKQMMQLKGCAQSLLLIEGKMRWSTDGVLQMDRGENLTWEQWLGLTWTMRLTVGAWIDFTDSLSKTVMYCSELEAWAKKPHHRSLHTRPGPAKRWGVAGARDWERHLLMGFDGIGPELADRILDTVGMPLRWGVTAEDLAGIRGLGPKKVRKIMANFPEQVGS